VILTPRNRNYKIKQFRPHNFSNDCSKTAFSEVEKYKEIEKSLAGIKFKYIKK